jgi:hypothetical protein
MLFRKVFIRHFGHRPKRTFVVFSPDVEIFLLGRAQRGCVRESAWGEERKRQREGHTHTHTHTHTE